MSEKYSTFHSTTGGVMTVEAGAITGDLEVCTKPAEGGVEITVRYAGADEWYVVEESPVEDREGCHERVVECLTTRGRKEGFNEEAVSLAELHG
ncbi:MAG: hypothetical protein H0U65_16535 [Rubrobacter sp.]|nr:hypothetical protein [Rubrobacter sp.]